jgi:hypothetical protein
LWPPQKRLVTMPNAEACSPSTRLRRARSEPGSGLGSIHGSLAEAVESTSYSFIPAALQSLACNDRRLLYFSWLPAWSQASVTKPARTQRSDFVLSPSSSTLRYCSSASSATLSDGVYSDSRYTPFAIRSALSTSDMSNQTTNRMPRFRRTLPEPSQFLHGSTCASSRLKPWPVRLGLHSCCMVVESTWRDPTGRTARDLVLVCLDDHRSLGTSSQSARSRSASVRSSALPRIVGTAGLCGMAILARRISISDDPLAAAKVVGLGRRLAARLAKIAGDP